MTSPAMPARGHAPTPCPRRETPQVTDTKDNTSNAKASKDHTPLMKHDGFIGIICKQALLQQ